MRRTKENPCTSRAGSEVTNTMEIRLIRKVQRHRYKARSTCLFGHELLMAATLDDSSMIKNHDDIGIANRRQAVDNDEYRSALHQIVHTVLNNLFGTRINR